MTVPWERGVRQKNTPMNKEAMYKNLLDFKEAMDRAEIPFILHFGTLLGLIRDGDLIEWDNDIDVACFSVDHRKLKQVEDELRRKGFYVPHRSESPFGDGFYIRGGEKVEIWFYQFIDNEWIYDNNIRYPEIYFKETENIKFLDTEFLIPHNPKKFLELTYGPTWKIPSRTAGYIL